MKSLVYVHKRGNAPCLLTALLLVAAGAFLTLFSLGFNTARHSEHTQRRTQTDDLTSYYASHKAYSGGDEVRKNLVAECTEETCRPPACVCARTSHPGSFPLREVPMMVMLSFDDHVNNLNFHHVQSLLDRRWKNPNKCPATFTFFSCDVATNYSYVRKLHTLGHEIGSHSVTHRFPIQWWTNASIQELTTEFSGQRDKLVQEAGVPHEAVKGIRVPFLMASKDRVAKMIQRSGFKYDSSLAAGSELVRGDPPWWPFTLDYPPRHLRIQGRYPGVWEVPLNLYDCFNGKGGYFMLDQCPMRNNTHEILGYLWRHFAYHYRSRAPMGLFMHVNWFNLNSASHEALTTFLDQLSIMPEVWLLSVSQVIQWIEQPTPISELKRFKPWGC
ncbi:chitin deacetylase 7 [Aplysia californica]|uniref:Chitin deacetylase 7 n=1 Tax=Aplysia californica TaxID=6500 RepID=A0ABM1A557_APLCA|nr:chitin deacetylase 7 [Aplysia californica]